MLKLKQKKSNPKTTSPQLVLISDSPSPHSESDIIWEETRSQLKFPIQMTVALPAYKAERIIWLALESLKNQQEIDFGWELIIWEEFGSSQEIVKSFCGQLPMCQLIRYHALSKRIPLMHKWAKIAQQSNSESKILVMHAADDYSPPKRLMIHHRHLTTNPKCFLSYQDKGMFYHLQTGKQMLYCWPNRIINLNMAYDLTYFRQIPKTSLRQGIDGYIRKEINKIINGLDLISLNDSDQDPENWKHSLCTDGANTISLSRRKVYSGIKRKPWQSYEAAQTKYGYTELSDYLPPDVIKFLENFQTS